MALGSTAGLCMVVVAGSLSMADDGKSTISDTEVSGPSRVVSGSLTLTTSAPGKIISKHSRFGDLLLVVSSDAFSCVPIRSSSTALRNPVPPQSVACAFESVSSVCLPDRL